MFSVFLQTRRIFIDSFFVFSFFAGFGTGAVVFVVRGSLQKPENVSKNTRINVKLLILLFQTFSKIFSVFLQTRKIIILFFLKFKWPPKLLPETLGPSSTCSVAPELNM